MCHFCQTHKRNLQSVLIYEGSQKQRGFILPGRRRLGLWSLVGTWILEFRKWKQVEAAATFESETFDYFPKFKTWNLENQIIGFRYVVKQKLFYLFYLMFWGAGTLCGVALLLSYWFNKLSDPRQKGSDHRCWSYDKFHCLFSEKLEKHKEKLKGK